MKPDSDKTEQDLEVNIKIDRRRAGLILNKMYMKEHLVSFQELMMKQIKLMI